MKVNVINLDNKKAGDIELADEVFGLAPRADLLQRMVRFCAVMPMTCRKKFASWR